MAWVMQAFVLLLCLLHVMALSSSWKAIKATKAIHERGHDHDYEYDETEYCEDLLSARRCQDAKRRYQICREPRGKNLCQRTCHVCHLKAPSPEVPCEETVLGCCWDGVTRKQGLSNEGCPPCNDVAEFTGLCRRWYMYCQRGRKQYREIVQQYCHRTCGKCQDGRKPVRKIVHTLAPVVVQKSNSANAPRRGAMYVWTKLVEN